MQHPQKPHYMVCLRAGVGGLSPRNDEEDEEAAVYGVAGVPTGGEEDEKEPKASCAFVFCWHISL